jgi:hypothetical protein
MAVLFQPRPEGVFGVKTITILFCAGFLAATSSGCGKKEEAPPAVSRSPQSPSAAKSGSTPSPSPSNPASEVKAAVGTAPKAVEPVVNQATTQAQGLIDQTQALLSEKKYQDALGAVQKLAGLKLNPEQQTLVEGLKTELGRMSGSIEKGIANLKEVAARKDYTGGMTLTKELASYQLTPEQKKVVDGLKLELQKLAGSQAAEEGRKALGGLLERKP